MRESEGSNASVQMTGREASVRTYREHLDDVWIAGVVVNGGAQLNDARFNTSSVSMMFGHTPERAAP